MGIQEDVVFFFIRKRRCMLTGQVTADQTRISNGKTHKNAEST